MVTDFLPLKTAFSLSSARMTVFALGSWSLFFLMYSQSFLVSSVRGSGLEPTTAARAASGWTGFMNAALGLRVVFLAISTVGPRGRRSEGNTFLTGLNFPFSEEKLQTCTIRTDGLGAGPDQEPAELCANCACKSA